LIARDRHVLRLRLKSFIFRTSMQGRRAIATGVRPLAGTMILLLWGAHNPLIRRYFLGVFRFARMALAEART